MTREGNRIDRSPCINAHQITAKGYLKRTAFLPGDMSPPNDVIVAPLPKGLMRPKWDEINKKWIEG